MILEMDCGVSPIPAVNGWANANCFLEATERAEAQAMIDTFTRLVRADREVLYQHGPEVCAYVDHDGRTIYQGCVRFVFGPNKGDVKHPARGEGLFIGSRV